jgi:hypothetical protein
MKQCLEWIVLNLFIEPAGLIEALLGPAETTDGAILCLGIGVLLVCLAYISLIVLICWTI